MATIMTQMRLQDNMTASLRGINNSINAVIGSLRNVDGELSRGFDSNKVLEAQRQVDLMNTQLNEAEENLKNNTNQQQRFNQEVNRGSTASGGLLNNIRNLAGAYMGVQGGLKLLGLSDQISSATARLNLIVDDGGSVEALKNKIYASANDARASYGNAMKDVSKLGILAGKAFSNNDELIKFTNLANKSFVVGGSSAQEQASAMYQLTQAMGSGRLQGDEYRSIIENAPLLAKSIEDYMVNVQHAKGSMKDWSSEGLLTSSVIKQAMFNAADETNRKFESIPYTWSQVWTTTVNKVIKATEPLLKVISLMAQNWDVVGPIVGTAAGAVAVYTGALLVNGAITAANTIGENMHTAALIVKSGATFGLTADQYGYNMALLACPINWIVAGIILLIGALYLAIAVINRTQNKSISATGIVTGCLYTLYAVAYNVVATIANIFSAFANFFANFLIDPVTAVRVLMYEMSISVLEIIQGMVGGIEALVNKIPGVKLNISAGFGNFIDQYKSYVQNVKDKAGFMDVASKLELKDYASSYKSGYSKGGKMSDNMSNLLDNLKNSSGETAKNTAKTADKLDATSEDLKYLRDIAERETINRFTTASLKIEQTNHNKIDSDLDIDGVVDKLVTKTNEALEEIAEGVHS